MKITQLPELMEAHLQKLYSCEKQLTEALPKLAKKATNEELQISLTEHLAETEEHVSRLEKIGKALDITLARHPDAGLAAMLAQSDELLADIEDPMVLDAAIMSGSDKVEHYEMACYKGAITLAEKLEVDSGVLDLLKESLGEEEAAAKKLEALAQAS